MKARRWAWAIAATAALGAGSVAVVGSSRDGAASGAKLQLAAFSAASAPVDGAVRGDGTSRPAFASEQERAAWMIEVFTTAWRSEPRDDAWAASKEEELRDLPSTHPSLEGVEVEVACRRTMCRIILSGDVVATRRAVRTLVTSKPFGTTGFYGFDSRGKVHAFVSRPGTSIADHPQVVAQLAPRPQ